MNTTKKKEKRKKKTRICVQNEIYDSYLGTVRFSGFNIRNVNLNIIHDTHMI
jgi:hypothetical protein